MTELVLLDADELDYGAFVRLQQDAFRALLQKSKASDALMTPDYFGWKLRPPAGNAKIAIVREGSRYLAANAMMPFALTLAGTRLLGWQSCDTATAPEARGNGYFLRCLEALRKAMSADDVFYGFPNESSSPGFAKIGWKPKHLVTTWLGALPVLTQRHSKDIVEWQVTDDRQETLSHRLSASARVMVERSGHYLDWRYRRHPLHRYVVHAMVTEGDVRGFSVLRVADVMGRRLALVMELWGLDGQTERALLGHASGWAVKQRARLLATFDTALPLAVGLRSGLLPVPQRMLPKKQILMGQPMAGAAANAAMAADWRVQMGDWDVF